MGGFNKRFVIREAESILEECNRKNNRKQIRDINELKNKNKKLKRMNIFWKICTCLVTILLIMMII